MKSFLPRLALLSILLCISRGVLAQSRTTIDLSGPGWKLWYDKDAAWQNDELFLPPADVSKMPTRPPTGGWDALNGIDVSVPGTAEEYLCNGNAPDDPYLGVTWWYRTISIPAGAPDGKLILHFDSCRQRTEVYLDHQLVGYDVVGNSPFDVDVTALCKPGEQHQLGLRITNPGGNYEWRDTKTIRWGRYEIPISHGFGGITGDVNLTATDSTYVDDVYVQNLPAITSVNVILTIQNSTAQDQTRDVQLTITDRADASILQTKTFPGNVLHPGANLITAKFDAPQAKIWDLDHPNLYVCTASLISSNQQVTDSAAQTFGFRWFSPEGEGTDGMFRLNGKRIMTRSAISWGFWPVNGIFPTPELAKKQIEDAKAFGLNMLNFHRAIGQPIILNDADEMGLLYYEEPGAYVTGDRSSFADAIRHEKLMRMVKRDRSHPSLVMYSMINEAWDSFGAGTDQTIFAEHVRDIQDAHAIDPSRMIIHTSAWVGGHGGHKYPADRDPARLHMLPFDDQVRFLGFWDFHRAGGPAVWNQSLYVDPTHYYGYTDDVKDVRFNGEEGAISTPPRLALIKDEIGKSPHVGWDSAVYLDWYRQFDEFLDKNDLRKAFPTVDSLCVALGDISIYHQGRKIENMRMNNVNDDYTINGWEAEVIDNHSGIVDCWRNPKGDPAIMAYYNQPLYVAVKSRNEISQAPGEFTVDFFCINEVNLTGRCTLRFSATDPDGKVFFHDDVAVSLKGGDVYGQLLAKGIRIPIGQTAGRYLINATLMDSAGAPRATGREEEYAVQWRNAKISPHGAALESGSPAVAFLGKQFHLTVPTYSDDSPPLDWVVATSPPGSGRAVLVSANQFTKLKAEFFAGNRFATPISSRTDANIDLSVEDGAMPDANAALTENYAVRWRGNLTPPASGAYGFSIATSGGVRLTINGQPVIDDIAGKGDETYSGRIDLEANHTVPIELDFVQLSGSANCHLLWSIPNEKGADVSRLFDRVANDGTRLIILDHADAWMPLVAARTQIKYNGAFFVGKAWLGGLHFVKEHPLFKDLPVNCGMDWPYQAVVRDGVNRMGLLIDGGSLVAGAYHSYPMQLGTAVGVIPLGKGKIIVSTLDVASNLNSRDTAAEVARKLFCNYLEY